MGVTRIYTPKDYQMTDIMADIADVVGPPSLTVILIRS